MTAAVACLIMGKGAGTLINVLVLFTEVKRKQNKRLLPPLASDRPLLEMTQYPTGDGKLLIVTTDLSHVL